MPRLVEQLPRLIPTGERQYEHRKPVAHGHAQLADDAKIVKADGFVWIIGIHFLVRAAVSEQNTSSREWRRRDVPRVPAIARSKA
jgi:hypothetical protein